MLAGKNASYIQRKAGSTPMCKECLIKACKARNESEKTIASLKNLCAGSATCCKYARTRMDAAGNSFGQFCDEHAAELIGCFKSGSCRSETCTKAGKYCIAPGNPIRLALKEVFGDPNADFVLSNAYCSKECCPLELQSYLIQCCYPCSYYDPETVHQCRVCAMYYELDENDVPDKTKRWCVKHAKEAEVRVVHADARACLCPYCLAKDEPKNTTAMYAVAEPGVFLPPAKPNSCMGCIRELLKENPRLNWFDLQSRKQCTHIHETKLLVNGVETVIASYQCTNANHSKLRDVCSDCYLKQLDAGEIEKVRKKEEKRVMDLMHEHKIEFLSEQNINLCRGNRISEIDLAASCGNSNVRHRLDFVVHHIDEYRNGVRYLNLEVDEHPKNGGGHATKHKEDIERMLNVNEQLVYHRSLIDSKASIASKASDASGSSGSSSENDDDFLHTAAASSTHSFHWIRYNPHGPHRERAEKQLMQLLKGPGNEMYESVFGTNNNIHYCYLNYDADAINHYSLSSLHR